MKKGWTVTRLVAAGALGVLAIVLTLPGFAISNIVQLPGSSIPFAGLVASMLTVTGLFTFRRFGAAAISMSVYGVLAIPMPIGPPGFLPKVFAFAATGLLLDILHVFLKREGRLNSAVLGAATMIFITLALVLTYVILLPGLALAYTRVLYILIAVGAAIGAVGGLAGLLLYRKLENTSVVKRIQA